MAIKKYYDSDCNLGVLDGKTVAVIGFGSQGHAHCLTIDQVLPVKLCFIMVIYFQDHITLIMLPLSFQRISEKSLVNEISSHDNDQNGRNSCHIVPHTASFIFIILCNNHRIKPSTSCQSYNSLYGF